MLNWPPRSLTACSYLPPEGAAAPAAWRSQFRGPCLKSTPLSRLCTVFAFLLHLGAVAYLGRCGAVITSIITVN